MVVVGVFFDVVSMYPFSLVGILSSGTDLQDKIVIMFAAWCDERGSMWRSGCGAFASDGYAPVFRPTIDYLRVASVGTWLVSIFLPSYRRF